jgi:mannose-6-phosphate isomerase-like protein (cupin superfamily)
MSPSPVESGREDLGRVLVRTSAELAALPWEDLRGIDGATHKVLWQSGATVIGLIRVEAGSHKPEHTHHGAHHHMFITKGSCVMLGQRVEEGSYVYVPPGVPHAVDDVGPEGVEFFYTYRPVDVGPAPDDDDVVAHPV